MLNLVMYSDQVIPENEKVDTHLLGLLAERGRRIGYVPSGPEPDRRFYKEKQSYYSKLGLDLSVFLDTGNPVDIAELSSLLECDAIHLPGGDTQSFQRILKANDLLQPLGDWARQGGVLIGTSAGAILMTPNVAVDAMFKGDDPSSVKDGEGLDLVPFEFFPHLNKSADYLPRLQSYSLENSRNIAACPDGDGIIVRDGKIESVGAIVWVRGGEIVDPPTMVR